MAEPFRLDKRQDQSIDLEAELKCQYLTFTLGKETFGIDIRCIREVIQYNGLTHVPLMPSYLRGVLNLRGSVVPVIDLSVRFQRAATEIARRTCIIIIELEQDNAPISMGVMVDFVNEVLDIAPSEIETAPSFGVDIRPDYIEGIGKTNGHFIILLDANVVLSIRELASLTSGHQREELAS